jgi:hypothetical protein
VAAGLATAIAAFIVAAAVKRAFGIP